MRLLVIEDDDALRNVLVRALREESYAVDQASDGQEGEWLAYENPYDAIVLDLMLPVKNGIEVLKSLRKLKIYTPVLILTAKDSKTELIEGLDSGADDYLTKPFDLDELLARIRTLVRRQPTEIKNLIELDGLTIDTNRKEVKRFDKLVELTTKEYSLLEFLARNHGRILSRTQLSDHVWDMNFEPNSNIVDVYIGYLRNKIDKDFNTNIIKTSRGHGYMLDLKEATNSKEVTIEDSSASTLS